MATLSIFLTKAGQKDEVISVYADDEAGPRRITYRSNDLGVTSFSLSADSVFNYLEDTLRMVLRDEDPFEHIQLSTRIHPSVIYRVSTLNDAAVFDGILNYIELALRTRAFVA